MTCRLHASKFFVKTSLTSLKSTSGPSITIQYGNPQSISTCVLGYDLGKGGSNGPSLGSPHPKSSRKSYQCTNMSCTPHVIISNNYTMYT